MTDIKPCTVKRCRETQYHHHCLVPGAPGVYGCDDPNSCATLHWEGFSPVAAPRPTRKALIARIAALEAENADLHAEIADKKDRLARCEKPETEALANLAQDALRAALRRGDANDATQYVRILDTIVQGGLNALTPDGKALF